MNNKNSLYQGFLELSPKDVGITNAMIGAPAEWEYRDMPPTLESLYDQLFRVIGEENCKILSVATITKKEGAEVYKRSQFMISPEGLKRLAAWKEELLLKESR